MNKLTIIGIIFLATIVLVGGLFAYSYTQLVVNLNNVEFQSIDWEPINLEVLLKLGINTLSGNWFDAAFSLIQGINLNLVFSLNNNGLLPVYIPDLYYDVLINDVPIGNGNSEINAIINPGQTKDIISFQNIRKDSMMPASLSIVNADGKMNIKVKGTAYFQLLGWKMPVPFESTKQISIYDEVRNKINAEIQKNIAEQNLNSSICGDGTHIENGKCVPDSIMEGVVDIFDEVKKQIDKLLK